MKRMTKGMMAAAALTLSAHAFAAPGGVPHRVVPGRGGRVVHRAGTGHAGAAVPRTVADEGAVPLVGADGERMYAYGAGRPTVRCAPLHVCVVSLLAGERIADLSLGDSVRWLIQATRAGDRPVVILKPTAAGIATNLVITTDDGHLYDLDLVSDPARFVPRIGFYDPKALVRAVARNAQMSARSIVATLPGVDPAKLDFAYWWHGPKAYRPVRVFSARGRVYIQMPARLESGDLPAVFVVAHGGQQIVNTRVAGSYLVVDQAFQEARLVLGVGRHRQVVTIHAGHKPLFPWQ